MADDSHDAAGVRMVALGFVAVIAIAGLVLLLTQSGVTGKVSGLQKLGVDGVQLRSPYEACRAVRNTDSAIGVRYVWNGFIDPRNQLIACVDPTDPENFYKTHYVELQMKYT